MSAYDILFDYPPDRISGALYALSFNAWGQREWLLTTRISTVWTEVCPLAATEMSVLLGHFYLERWLDQFTLEIACAMSPRKLAYARKGKEERIIGLPVLWDSMESHTGKPRIRACEWNSGL